MTAPGLFEAIRYDLARVEELLPAALAVREHVGRYVDPTADMATDHRRLVVRDAVRQAITALARTQRDLVAARSALHDALERWDG